MSVEELRARMEHPALFAAADDLAEAELARRREAELARPLITLRSARQPQLTGQAA